jgi:hypothetical protein
MKGYNIDISFSTEQFNAKKSNPGHFCYGRRKFYSVASRVTRRMGKKFAQILGKVAQTDAKQKMTKYLSQSLI